MKLVTFQSIDAIKDLFSKGYLECKESKLDLKKNGYAYSWIVEKMNNYVSNEHNVLYPIWCWVKCYNSIAPAKRKGDKVVNYDVKITFHKDEKDVFVTDFRRYSFLLNNMYIPDDLKDLIRFNKKIELYNISNEDLKDYVRKDKYSEHRTDKEFLDICREIKESFDKCITYDSDVLQGCVWRINLSDIDTIEILPNDGYRYGSINYIRSNGKRIDWINDFYKKIK